MNPNDHPLPGPEAEPVSEPCPACGAVVDETGLPLLGQTVCPACGAEITLRTHLGHYHLLNKIGQGGMGEVFRAMDLNLHREIALKVLHRDFSGSAEEQEKLAAEARRTASINHPNVVKVFNYGSSGGQFYLAMELVPHGTLDDLMELQGRVSEIQVLNVGWQMASGLKAALECGLIHRDIKPGNILFADAATAKLVDFGLALVMDEVAAAKGEIWGTPYYVAPEKLDGGDEDFRSDIYSLGGSLFHALAGRPPYEAETASMVALKQLKSQPVFLQTYAPDVSEETAYVINRMMAKDPAARYQSYDEILEHLEFSRGKILERLQSTGGAAPQPAVVQVESTQQRKLIGLLMLGLLAGFFFLLGAGYVYRERLAEALGIAGSTGDRINAAQVIQEGREFILSGHPDEAIPLLVKVSDNSEVEQPLRNWATMQLGVAQLLAGLPRESAETFRTLQQRGPFSEASDQLPLAGFFVEMGRLLANPRVVSFPRFGTENYDALGLFAAGLHNWANGEPRRGAGLLQEFAAAPPPAEPYRWISVYQPLAGKLAADAEAFQPLQRRALNARTPAQIESARRFLRNAPAFDSGNTLAIQIDNLQKHLDSLEKPDP